MNKIEIPYTTAPLSEYIGSHIYETIGIPVHKTVLGVREGKVVVACKDLLKPDEKIVDFAALKTRAVNGLNEKIDNLDSITSGNGTDLPEILLLMENIPVFVNNPLLVEHFWNMFVVDGLIGNNDRNNGNWGIIRNVFKSGSVKICPVFDNGNSFSNKMGEPRMKRILEDPVKFKSSAIDSPTSVFFENGKKINPFKYIESFKNEDLNQAILRIVPNIDLNKIKEIIDEIPNIDKETGIKIISDIQKEFYYRVLEARYEQVLLPAYEKLYDKVIDKNYELYKDKIEAIYSEEFGKDFKNKTNFESLVKSNMKEDILSLNKGYLIYKDDEDNEYLVTNIKDKDIKVIKTKDISELLEQNENNGEEE